MRTSSVPRTSLIHNRYGQIPLLHTTGMAKYLSKYLSYTQQVWSNISPNTSLIHIRYEEMPFMIPLLFITGIGKIPQKSCHVLHKRYMTKLRFPFSHVPSFQIGDFFLLHLISKNVEEVMGRICAN